MTEAGRRSSPMPEARATVRISSIIPRTLPTVYGSMSTCSISNTGRRASSDTPPQLMFHSTLRHLSEVISFVRCASEPPRSMSVSR